MHNNYYFLRQLSHAVESFFKGTVISECFSQNKNELVIRFEKGTASHYIRVSVEPAFSCLTFPQEFHRARKNSVDLFPDIVGRRVTGTTQFEHERSFAVTLSDDFALLFKMHGNRSNVIVCHAGAASALFNQSLDADMQITLMSLHRDIDFSKEAFERSVDNLQKLYFTFGKVVWRYLHEKNFDAQSVAEKWESVQRVLAALDQPSYYIVESDNAIALSLLPFTTTVKQLEDPVAAANAFYYAFIETVTFRRESDRARQVLINNLSSGKIFLEKTESKLNALQQDQHFKAHADLIMANLHVIKQGSTNIELTDFTTGEPVKIKLKPDQSPQKNAESLYRKAKNQHIELSHLEKRIESKRKELQDLDDQLRRITSATNLKDLRKLTGHPADEKKKATVEPLPYHEFEHRGFRIWVGKNASHNDTLTFRYTYKDDLWLHAKDVSGSHVVVKHQSGKPFPKDVIERAAELAAFHSKRKTETLAPVSFTPKKYVRKRKGDPPGAVVVEREKVILVEPRKGD